MKHRSEPTNSLRVSGLRDRIMPQFWKSYQVKFPPTRLADSGENYAETGEISPRPIFRIAVSDQQQ